MIRSVTDEKAVRAHDMHVVCVCAVQWQCLPAERRGLALAEHQHGRLQLLHLAEDGRQLGPLDHKRLHLHL